MINCRAAGLPTTSRSDRLNTAPTNEQSVSNKAQLAVDGRCAANVYRRLATPGVRGAVVVFVIVFVIVIVSVIVVSLWWGGCGWRRGHGALLLLMLLLLVCRVLTGLVSAASPANPPSTCHTTNDTQPPRTDNIRSARDARLEQSLCSYQRTLAIGEDILRTCTTLTRRKSRFRRRRGMEKGEVGVNALGQG